jgi:hypothetical protein
MLKNAYSPSYRKMSELSSPPITLAVLGVGYPVLRFDLTNASKWGR